MSEKNPNANEVQNEKVASPLEWSTPVVTTVNVADETEFQSCVGTDGAGACTGS